MGPLISATHASEVPRPTRRVRPAEVGNYYNNIVVAFGQDLGWSLVGYISSIALGNISGMNTVFLGMPQRSI
ncbi:MAG: hypothetical protein ACMG55_08895 [Microcoleus sp.]